MKMQFAQRVLSCMPLFLAKMALLCFFAEFVPKVLLKTWWSIRIAMFVVVACMIATEVMIIFSCDPISSQWNVKVGEQCMPSFWEAGVKSWMAMQLGTDILGKPPLSIFIQKLFKESCYFCLELTSSFSRSPCNTILDSAATRKCY